MSNFELVVSARDGGSFSAYVAGSENRDTAVVLILQEIFGVNANIRGVADEFAALGYIAVAPDLFWRQAPGLQLNPASEGDRDRAMALMQKTDESLAVEDVLATIDAANTLPGASGKVGVVGYCFGGRLAFLLSTYPQVNVAVSYYGTGLHQKLGLATEIKARLLVHVARNDHLCPPEAQAKIEETLAPFANNVTVMFYNDAGHAFARNGAATFVAEASERANAATYAALGSALR